ncbi:excisionase family DNA-binding protein [Actinomadura nitritigenes]|uniref:Excisionase family DNA-binding protein n=1 Tax=Actinomadura nitritigenes TaxID=134602 RepID=A0ABS3R6I6_9ACTN|nr:excisionase family DNA-binding protein [Actinomadura nitritigenes]MBO2441840.1 excisionase family DNA-binding protein [Actinomadura nitritigenes]
MALRKPGPHTRRDARHRRTHQLLTVVEAADYLNTSQRFPHRLIAGRRIRSVKLGRFVCIPEFRRTGCCAPYS